MDKRVRTNAKIGNGDFLKILNTGTIAVETPLSSKFIIDIYYVLEVDQNLLSVGQLANNHHTILFKDKNCTIFYPTSEKNAHCRNEEQMLSTKLDKHRALSLLLCR